MKPASLGLVLALTLCAGDKDDVQATLRSWGQAMTSRDAAALEKLYHPDLTYEHSSSKTENKAEAIEAVVKSATPYTAVEFHTPSIRIYGNTALAKGVLDINTAAAKNHLDALFVLLKTGNGWQIVARQTTKIP